MWPIKHAAGGPGSGLGPMEGTVSQQESSVSMFQYGVERMAAIFYIFIIKNK